MVKSGETPIHAAESNQLCDRNVVQHYGFLTTPQNRKLFFWFFESRNSPSTDPFVVWTNGGPGCSSLFGMFGELGPCFVRTDDTTTALNPFSWNNNANILFIDQPYGTGFSNYVGSGNRPVDSQQSAADFGAFIQLFMKQFPQYANLDFHITGESYAGRYVPNMASGIVKVNLKSIAMGNSLWDPLTQYKYYSAQACRSPYPPILSTSQCASIDRYYTNTCGPLIQQCYNNPSSNTTCSRATSSCNNGILGVDISPAGMYDVRVPQQDDPYRGDYESYLQQSYVRTALGVGSATYTQCSNSVYSNYVNSGDWMRPYHTLIPQILAKNVRVLLYAGDADYICNAIGNKAAAFALTWPGKSGFNAAPTNAWTVNGQAAGQSWAYQNFAFVTVYEAGHMMPENQPERAQALIQEWLKGNVVSGSYTVTGYNGLTMDTSSQNPIP
ncbi:alpha/beta-hydrolase [Ramicandelaber brevisporus]|nr:alpha/beta-hydrolase [Ramicandelaber brevisporus]